MDKILYKLVYKDMTNFWLYNNCNDEYKYICTEMNDDEDNFDYLPYDKIYVIDHQDRNYRDVDKKEKDMIIFDSHIDVTLEYKTKNVSSNVNHPSHYTDGKIEVIDYIEDKKFDYCLGNAIKYISRAGKKNPDKTIEDLEKAIWYIQRRIKQLKEE